MFKKIGLLSILISSLSISALADEAFIINYFGQLSTLEGNFKQTVIQQKNKEVSSGSFKIRKKTPNNPTAGFYFDYTNPFEQKIISNGKKLWHYDIDLEQVVIKNLASFEQDSPMFMIFSDQSLSSKFDIKTIKNQAKYRLTPKKKSDVTYIDIEFSRGNISKVMAQQPNNSLELQLLNVQSNQNINANIFTFKAPKGVDIIDETK